MAKSRSERQSSVEDGAAAPTRTSRRLRSTQDDNASPLRSLSPPKRKRTSSRPPKESSKLYISQKKPSKEAQQQDDATTSPHDLPSPVESLTLETIHKYHSAFTVATDERVRASIIQELEVIANRNPTTVAHMLLDQRSQIINQTRKAEEQQRLADLETRRATEANKKLETTQAENAQLKEQINGKQRSSPPATSAKSSPRKRPAPTEDGDENEERPSQRQRLSPESTSQSPQESTQTSPETSPKMTNGTTTTATLSASDVARQYPAAASLAALNAKARYSDDSSDEEDTPTKNQPDTAFKRFMQERERQKELERKKEEWFGAAFTRPDLPFPLEAVEASAEHFEDQQPTETLGEDVDQISVVSETADVTEELEPTALVHENYTSTALSPISEATEPETPAARRWGFSSVLAPVSRLFGLTPRTEPARRTSQPANEGTTAPTTTPSRPSANTAMPRQPASEQSTRTKTSQVDGAQDEEPSTPTHNAGITKESFMPQSAPQARAPLTGRRAKSIHQRIKEQEQAASRREALEEAKRQAAFEAEEKRLQEDIAIKRAESEKWIAAKHAKRHEDLATEATQKTGEKRKVRIDDLQVIPGPAGGGVGMNEKWFDVDENGYVTVDDSDVSMLDAFTPPPAKKVRFGDNASPSTTNTPKAAASQKAPTPAPASQNAPTPVPTSQKAPTPAPPSQKKWWQQEIEFNTVSPHKATPSSSMSEDPHRARPYTGRMFADPAKENSYSGGNVFESQTQKSPKKRDLDEAFLSPITYGQKYGVWIGPKRTEPTPKGTFAVPDDSDSDDDDLYNDPTSPTPPQKSSGDTPSGASSQYSSEETTTTEMVPRTNIFEKQSEAAKTSAEQDNGQEEPAFSQQPPPTPTPAHAALPNTPGNNNNGAEALAKARSQAEKYKPKTPSGLRAASRLSSSPGAPDTNDRNKRTTGSIFGSTAPTFGNIDPALEATSTAEIAAPLFSAPKPSAPAIFTPSPFPASTPAVAPSFSFGQSAISATPVATSQPAIVAPTHDTYATGESLSIPYKQTRQYAIDLANAIPVEELGECKFIFPEVPERPISPGFAAYLAEQEARPDWEQSIEDVWNLTIKNWNEECAAGVHGPNARPIIS